MTPLLKRLSFTLLVITAALSFSGCSTNPVTGKKELSLVSEAQEKAIGRKNYSPYRQAQGGDYVVDTALTEYVQEIGQKLAAVSDRKLDYEFKVVNDSTPNAWALPGGKIALNRGLLVELGSEAELAAVLGHEVVHAAARHSAKAMERNIFFQGAVLAAGVALGDSNYRQAGMLGAQLGAGLGQMHFSRDAEREADSYGIEYMVRAGYDPAAAVDLQETFVRLSEGNNPSWLEGLFASHPPSPERVQNNRKLLQQKGHPGGVIGKERYQKAIARLKRTKPAYDAYDEASKALEEGEEAKALKLVNKAIRIEPKEAQFHTLKGEILERQGNEKKALKSFDLAMRLNPGYYRVPLARGLLRYKMGDVAAAKSDLDKSLALLPTAEGNLGLGLLAQKRGQNAQAVRHFRTASQSDSAVGEKAGTLLARLDLPHNPERYIKATLGLSADGFLSVRLHNQSRVAVKNVGLTVGQAVGAELISGRRYTLRRALPAGGRIDVKTDIGPLGVKKARKFRALVTDAKISSREVRW